MFILFIIEMLFYAFILYLFCLWVKKLFLTEPKKEKIEDSKILQDFVLEEAKKLKENKENEIKKSKEKIKKYKKTGEELNEY